MICFKRFHLILGVMIIILCNGMWASEYFKGYDVNQPQVRKPSTPRALEYERAYNKDAKEHATGFYDRFKGALGFKAAAQPRPRVAEYEAAFSPYSEQKNAPWNTPWYEHRTYEEPLPENVKKALNAHQKELTEMSGNVASFEWLPGYMVKMNPGKDFSRIEGAKTFTSAIQGQRNPTIYIPQKYEYTLTNPEGNLGDYIISEKVPIVDMPITKGEAKAMSKLSFLAKWYDSHTGNFVKMAPGRLAIIDTEPRFKPEFPELAVKRYINESMLTYPKPFNAEAIDYLKDKQMQLRYKKRGWHFRLPPSKKSFYSQMGL